MKIISRLKIKTSGSRFNPFTFNPMTSELQAKFRKWAGLNVRWKSRVKTKLFHCSPRGTVAAGVWRGDGTTNEGGRVACVWKFSPPVAEQFPWKRSYGHGFRQINTAYTAVRARASGNERRTGNNMFPGEDFADNVCRKRVSPDKRGALVAVATAKTNFRPRVAAGRVWCRR